MADSLRDTETADVAMPDTTITPADVSRVAELTPSDTASVAVKTDSLSITAQDSLSIARHDSLSVSKQDSLSMEDQTLKAAVYYTAQDSMIFTSDNMGYLYGDADIKYGEMGIKGEYITMDMDSSVISSTFGVDSVGKEFGLPVFSEGGTEYEMKKVRYNFETRKAFINNVVTQQGEETSWPMRQR